MEEIDIWRTAKILIDSHAEEAAMEAAMRADHALEDGNPDAVQVWTGVMRAIEDLQRPADGKTVNWDAGQEPGRDGLIDAGAAYPRQGRADPAGRRQDRNLVPFKVGTVSMPPLDLPLGSELIAR